MTGNSFHSFRKGGLVALFILIGPLSMVFSGVTPNQQTAPTPLEKDQLVGTWMLVSMRNDKKVEMLGNRPLGMLVFDRDGHYASQVMRSDLPKFASPDRTKATPEESQVIIRGFMGLFGTYTVDASGTLHLHVISSSFPNWNGADQTRAVILQGNELELTNRTNSFGESAVHAFWKRVSPPH
jgi:hypothetical protein